MRSFKASVIVLVAIIMIMTTVGVSATWSYCAQYANPVENSFALQMAEFKWQGSEELPDDVEGENHAWLVTNLVAGKNDSGEEIGLNNPDSPINDYVNDRLDGGFGYSARDYFGSMAVTGGQDMEELFGADAINLTFMIYVVSETEYYIFTTDVYLGERGEPNWLNTSNKTPGKPTTPLGQYISPIYRTKLTRSNKNEDWNIIETKKGEAKSCWYDENRRNNITQIPSFDPTSWRETT
ncbi:MAG: hypothetical protein IKA74_04260 [Clostridia bacterium]|nr:hypothetical protein [Clostridia bacterium]